MIEIKNGDCLELIKHIKDNSVDLVFADPPFNIGYKYDNYKDNKTSKEYEDWCENWIKESYRVLKENGTMWVAIGDEYAAELCILLKKRLKMRNWVIWHYTFGNNCTTKFSRCHTHLLYFTKSNKFTFNTNSIRIKSDRQKLGDKRANPLGKVPSDVWTVSRVCGTFKERCNWHPCQMPLEILNRIIKACTNKGDFVLDLFSGSGTTGLSAKELERNFLGFELSKEYTDKSLERINNIKK